MANASDQTIVTHFQDTNLETIPDLEEEIDTTETQDVSDRRHQEAVQELMIDQTQEMIRQRKKRSNRILLCIIFRLLFSATLTILVGLGKLTFQANTIPRFVAQSVLNVLGLGIIITKFLFNKDSLLTDQYKNFIQKDS